MSATGGKFRRRRRTSKPAPKLATKTYVRRAISSSKELLENHIENVAENAAYDGGAIHELDAFTTGAGTAGDKIEIVSAMVRMIFANPASAGAVFVRVIVFQWYQDSANQAPTEAELIQGSLDAQSVLAPLDFLTVDNVNRVKIIKDFVVRLGEATSTDGADKAYRQLLIGSHNLGRKYIQATGAASGRNKLYMCVISDVADASSPPTVVSQSSFKYKMESAGV